MKDQKIFGFDCQYLACNPTIFIAISFYRLSLRLWATQVNYRHLPSEHWKVNVKSSKKKEVDFKY